MNVVLLIDTLLVLLILFLVTPHPQIELSASLLKPASDPGPAVHPEISSFRSRRMESIRLSGSFVQHDVLRDRQESTFVLRAHRVAFLQGDRSLEFQLVAGVLDVHALCWRFLG
ncbi:MAG: hypothetical protein WBR26_20735 [Candidatus Acidiferrum sp.]